MVFRLGLLACLLADGINAFPHQPHGEMPTFLVQCGPNKDPNIRKVRNADLMPPLRTFLLALHSSSTCISECGTPS